MVSLYRRVRIRPGPPNQSDIYRIEESEGYHESEAMSNASHPKIVANEIIQAIEKVSNEKEVGPFLRVRCW